MPLVRRALCLLAVAVAVALMGSSSARPASTELFFSEYVAGTGNNKALEIYNGTGAPVNLGTAGYAVQIFADGGTTPLTLSLTGTIAAGDVFVLAQSGADPAIIAQADRQVTLTFNGNDAVVLARFTPTRHVVDAIGQVGFNPGTEWGTGTTTTANHTLRRKGTVEAGDTNELDAFDPALQWNSFPVNTFDGLGSHTVGAEDAAPAVSSTIPGNGATNVATDANVSITFSEDVNVTGSWFGISCTVSGAHTAVASTTPSVITLDPATDFAPAETCTVTVVASQVSDADGSDPPDTMAENYSFSFSTDAAPAVLATSPANGDTGVLTDANVSITFSEDVSVSGTWYSISCQASGVHTASVTGGAAVYTLDPDANFVPGETCAVMIFAGQVRDTDAGDPPDTLAGNYSFGFSTTALRIHDLQGAGHVSPFNGQTVAGISGVVTAVAAQGFYMQDPAPDADDATSEGTFVFTSVAPAVSVGDSVAVTGRATEFRPGGSGSTNLSTTELDRVTSTQVLSSGNPLPPATVFGTGGRIPPSEVIENDATGSVEASGVFDSADDGIDFYESVEGMRVQVNDAVAVGPTNGFGEIPVVADGGANAGIRTVRGGVVIRPTDFNPERIFLDDTLARTPVVNVGDGLAGQDRGMMDYSFGTFKLPVYA